MNSSQLGKCLAMALVVASPIASQAAYTTNFDAATALLVDGDNFAPLDGWAINYAVTPSNDEISFVRATAFGFHSIGLGGLREAPPLPNINLTHAVSQVAAGAVLSLDLAIINRDSSDLGFFTGEDNFGFTLSQGASDLFTIQFLPSTGNGIAISVNGTPTGGVGFLADEHMAINPRNLTVSFTPNGANLDFLVTLKTSTVDIVYPSSIPGAAGAVFDKFGADFDVVGDGQNYLLFDNLSLVPEPGVAVMGLFSMCLLGVRRRR